MTDSIGFDLEPMVATPVVTAMPVVINQGGKLLVSSRNVAEVFEKEHKNVLQDVRAVIAACSQDFARLNFQLGSYKDANNQERPEYLLTKDGFTMLAMGYTGVKAMQFKEAYINRFNEMATQLKQGSISNKLKDTKLVLESKPDIAFALDKVYQEHYGVSALSYLPATEPAPMALPQNSTAAFVKGIGLKRLCERTVPEWYNLYVEYCYNHGKAPMAKTEFSKQAKRCDLQIVRKRVAGKIVKVFTAK